MRNDVDDEMFVHQKASQKKQDWVTQMSRLLLRQTDYIARLKSDHSLVLTVRNDGSKEFILPALLEAAAE